MHIDKIKINNFKNYKTAQINFSKKINFLFGKNGAGKTNLLDSIHYLSYGKSAVNSFDFDNINYKESFFSISGFFNNKNEYKCVFDKSGNKVFYENEIKYKSLKEHIGKTPSVFINPYDINLIRNYSQDRRKFFDQIFSQINSEYLDSLISYKRLIKQRNTYLKKVPSLYKIDTTLINSYNEKLIELNNIINKIRKKELDELNKKFNSFSTKLMDDGILLSISYSSNIDEKLNKALFEKYLEKDFYTKKTNLGIHNDDYIFYINNKLIKRVGSQGQQKIFIISLKLAEFETLKINLAKTPILLLDDIFHKLDDSKINLLIELILEDNFEQIIISDSIENRLNKIQTKIPELKIFDIKNGDINERK